MKGKLSNKYPTIGNLFIIDVIFMLVMVFLHIVMVLTTNGYYTELTYYFMNTFPSFLFGIAAIFIPIILTFILTIIQTIVKWHDLSHEYEHHKRHPREKVIKHVFIDFLFVISIGVILLGIISTILFFMGVNGPVSE